MSLALAVIRVNVFVCLTLRKRGLGREGRSHSKEGTGGDGGQEFSGPPSLLGYGAAAWTKFMSKRNHCFK